MEIDADTLIEKAIPSLLSFHNGFYPLVPISKEERVVKVVAKSYDIPFETIDLYRFKWDVDEILVEETADEETINTALRFFLSGVSNSKNCPQCKNEEIIPIVYGLVDVEFLEENEKVEKFIYRGCNIPKNANHWYCRNCKNEWS